MQSINVTVNGEAFKIINMYAHSNRTVKHLGLQEIFLDGLQGNVIVKGDMNAHHPELGSNKTNGARKQIVDLLNDVPQIKIVSPPTPTHIQGGRLDYSITNIHGKYIII